MHDHVISRPASRRLGKHLASWLSRAVLAAALLPAPMMARGERFAFGVLGDAPYNDWQRAQMPALIAEMNIDDLAFVIHVGDFKHGDAPCTDTVYRDRRELFDSLHHPLVLTPGDNDWSDCARPAAGGYQPEERLERLRAMFFSGSTSLGQTPMPLVRQSPDYPENQRWQRGRVLFMTLNVPGGNNHIGDPRKPNPEYVARMHANLAWLAAGFAMARAQRLAAVVIAMQANPRFMRAPAGLANPGFEELIEHVRRETLEFSGRVLWVHGDSHLMRIDTPLLDAGVPLKRLTRLETYGSPFLGWIRVRVDDDTPEVFRFEPQPYRPPRPPSMGDSRGAPSVRTEPG